MIMGHTRCLVDGCFGLIKQRYRCHDCDILDHLVDVVNKSASCNKVQVYRSGSGTANWHWRNWDSSLGLYFKPIKGIRKLHHFRFLHAEPGTMYVKESIHDQEVAINILHPSADASILSLNDLPSKFQPAGLTIDRERDLFSTVREYVTPQFRDELCPSPSH